MDNVKQLAQKVLQTESGIIVATIPASYAALYKKTIAIDIRGEDIGKSLIEMIEAETKIPIQTEHDLEVVNEHYKHFGFLTVNDYILFHISRQITPYIRVCRSCKHYHNGICLTYGYAMCETNWGCKEFV